MGEEGIWEREAQFQSAQIQAGRCSMSSVPRVNTTRAPKAHGTPPVAWRTAKGARNPRCGTARPELPRQAVTTTQIARVELVNRGRGLHHALRAETRADQVNNSEFPVIDESAQVLLHEIRMVVLAEAKAILHQPSVNQQFGLQVEQFQAGLIAKPPTKALSNFRGCRDIHQFSRHQRAELDFGL